MRVRIGMSTTARELDLEVADGEEFIRSFQQALEQGNQVFWVTDEEERRYGLVADKIAYVAVDSGKAARVGFGNE